jgi:hypothetical protein
MGFAGCNKQVSGQTTVVIKYGMYFDRTFAFAELGQIKDPKTQGYRSGINDENLSFELK